MTKYTQHRKDDATIVVDACKFVLAQTYAFSRGEGLADLQWIRDIMREDWYTTDNHMSGYGITPRVVKYHGPMPLSRILAEDYLRVHPTEVNGILNDALSDNRFTGGYVFDQAYIAEAHGILTSATTNSDAIFRLNKKVHGWNDNEWFQYDYYIEFLVKQGKQAILIIIGED